MPTPNPDTSEFAALLDFVATGGRARDQLKPHQNPTAITAEILAPRAKAMTTALVAIAHAVLGRPR